MRRIASLMILATLLGTSACDVPTNPEPATRAQGQRPGTTSILPPSTLYPLHLYGAPSDAWPYVTTDGTYVELPADDLTPAEYFDGRSSCPIASSGSMRTCG
jgi:hypothetical protein